ncbi:hypothetical protein AKJ50_01485 [candidate division MSBL1 archaeon SCGC-AAA382A13]|uniref:Type I restriction enzyme R protein N-terminal domain-containing protein n=1 Tax=candidate division MSBL1 archaeon SCGC-AAA382A13 TaxID=1698279 RepID=A0A133VFL1_9EURY|nr:hypothetical protein AKJ50_01485 [candidate division MSBL1 archaeon SCGC-AAA382A13]
MKKKDWITFVEKIEKLIKTNPNRSEAETKSKIVEPLLRRLGWSFVNDEVEVEYPLDFDTASHVDYALLIDEKPSVFIEVKPLGSDLTTEAQEQGLDYATHENVEWFALTNGTKIKIFNTEWGTSLQDTLAGKAFIQEFKEKWHVFEKISKNSIMSEKTSKRVQAVKKAKKSIARIKKNRKNIQEQIAKVLKEHSEELLYDELEKISKEFVNNLPEKLNDYAKGKTKKDEDEVREPISKILRKNKLLPI